MCDLAFHNRPVHQPKTRKTSVVVLITQRPVDALQRCGARYEDATLLPARLTLPPLVELSLVVR